MFGSYLSNHRNEGVGHIFSDKLVDNAQISIFNSLDNWSTLKTVDKPLLSSRFSANNLFSRSFQPALSHGNLYARYIVDIEDSLGRLISYYHRLGVSTPFGDIMGNYLEKMGLYSSTLIDKSDMAL